VLGLFLGPSAGLYGIVKGSALTVRGQAHCSAFERTTHRGSIVLFYPVGGSMANATLPMQCPSDTLRRSRYSPKIKSSQQAPEPCTATRGTSRLQAPWLGSSARRITTDASHINAQGLQGILHIYKELSRVGRGLETAVNIAQVSARCSRKPRGAQRSQWRGGPAAVLHGAV
jgi:hypothetical protein